MRGRDELNIIMALDTKVEKAKEELRRWQEEPSAWCVHKENLTRKFDSCAAYENYPRSSVMILVCHTCKFWGENSDA